MNLFYCVFLLIHLVSCSEVKNDDGLKKINDINSKENTIRLINPKDSISKPTSFERIATDEKQLKVKCCRIVIFLTTINIIKIFR